MRSIQHIFRGKGRSRLLGLLVLLAGLGLLENLSHMVTRIWKEISRPAAFFHRSISQGVAVSLNALEDQLPASGPIPAMRILGVLSEPEREDWIIFGEADLHRPELPADTVAIAVRAIRLELELPGIDIRPAGEGKESTATVQRVEYFGGVSKTVVGEWFFLFDYWMKQATLDYDSLPRPAIPIYWRRAVKRLEEEIETCDLTGQGLWVHQNRYWLCTGDFTAIETKEALIFQETPLRVLVERYPSRDLAAGSAASPCLSGGTDDRLAADFSNAVTEHLDELARGLPVWQIEAFARLLAGLTWLADQDPYRDLAPWLEASLAPTKTPSEVPSLARHKERSHTALRMGSLVSHRHRLEVSGGVLVSPKLILARAGDSSLEALRETIVVARPDASSVSWRFRYDPPSFAQEKEDAKP